MLDDYKDSQNVIYSMIKNSIKLNKVSHAYLIDSNNYYDIEGFVFALVKTFICPYNYLNYNNCPNCNKCMRIDSKNYPEVRHIYPDGLNIKKEQLLELQEDFNLSTIEGNVRIYVIWNCEKMNASAANCILKFLEEPVSNIIAILVTNAIDLILPTIISRCQCIKLTNNISYLDTTFLNVQNLVRDVKIGDSITVEDIENYILSVIDFINYFESNKLDTLLYLNKLWNSKFSDRTSYLLGLNLIIEFYYDVLKFKLGNNVDFFVDYTDNIIKIADKLEVESIVYRISVYLEYLDYVKYNLNLNLLMDGLIIKLGEFV